MSVCVSVHIGVNQRTVKNRESTERSDGETDERGETQRGQSVRYRRRSEEPFQSEKRHQQVKMKK